MSTKNDKDAFIKDFSEKVVNTLVNEKHMPREEAKKLAGALVPQAFDDGKSNFFTKKEKLASKLMGGALVGGGGLASFMVATDVIRNQLSNLPTTAVMALFSAGILPAMVGITAGDRLRDLKKYFSGNDKGNRKIRRLGYAALRDKLKEQDVEIPKKPKKFKAAKAEMTFSKS